MAYKSISNDTNFQYVIKEDISINFFDKNQWGPRLWTILHTFSYNYSIIPTEEEALNATNFFNSICLLLPCDYCKNHCREFIQTYPPRTENRNNLINWVLLFHNNVNRRLYKQTWTREQLDSKFDTGNAYCK